ncbi:MAG: hypothetical protein KC621_15265 [Myxococcales bacterium]|nr:hypothetical protein [Myxococcales bacterium]
MRWGRLLAFLGYGAVLHLAAVGLYDALVTSGHKALRNDRVFLAGPGDVDVLVLGDSHPRTAIDVRFLGPACASLAIGGQDLVKTWYRFHQLVEQGDKHVGTLVVGLDPSSFSAWRSDLFAPEVVWGRYVDFWELGREQGEPLRYVQPWLEAHVVPYAGELRTFNQLRTRRFGFGDDLPRGFFSALPPVERRAKALSDAKEHFKDQDLAHPPLRAAWQHLVDWADERGVSVVAVTFPTTPEYEVWVRRAGARETMESEVARPFVQADPEHHVWLDWHAAFDAHPEAFADSNHLNAAGRTVLSRRLAEELRRRGLLGERTGGPGFEPDEDLVLEEVP